jgi:hypothetical protein
MLNVSKLSVSLTKHGAHKLSLLLRKYDKDNLLNHLEGVEPGINIEAAQARANLSVGPTGVVPEVWNKARTAGTEAIDGLTLLAIIFSHRDLIRAMREGRNQAFRGIVRRGQVLDGKAVTNFAHTLEELGYSVDHTPDHISFNLARLFEIPGLHKLAFELLQLKMRPAGWLPREPLVDALVAAKLNEVLAITPDPMPAKRRPRRGPSRSRPATTQRRPAPFRSRRQSMTERPNCFTTRFRLPCMSRWLKGTAGTVSVPRLTRDWAHRSTSW